MENRHVLRHSSIEKNRPNAVVRQQWRMVPISVELQENRVASCNEIRCFGWSKLWEAITDRRLDHSVVIIIIIVIGHKSKTKRRKKLMKYI